MPAASSARSTRSDQQFLADWAGAREAISRAFRIPGQAQEKGAAMREGSLEAPTRHVLDWENPDFADRAKTETEMERVFDICHICRRCFALCDSFPRLFDLVDNSPSGELDSVAKADYKQVADACTLCDMCFMTKCPYVPPHEFNVDFPHLMLRYRAVEAKEGKVPLAQRELTKTDRNGTLAGMVAPLANWASDRHNKLTRPAMEKITGVDRNAALPAYHGRTFAMRAKATPPAVDRSAPGAGRKAVLYATCFVNYNNPSIGEAAQAVLARNGVETEVVYPQCCGMPQLESGDLAAVAKAAKNVAATLGPWIDKGYDVIALVPSCALMLKFEWPLIVPNDAGSKSWRPQPSTSASTLSRSPRIKGWRRGSCRSTAASRCTSPAMRARRMSDRRRRRCCDSCPTHRSRSSSAAPAMAAPGA
jgi:glycerol-3-phosphate dehydrogenase subunit C